MILDDIIAALVAIFEVLIEALTIGIEPIVNLFAAAIEAVVRLFSPDFKLGRMKREKRRPKASAITGLLTLLIIISTLGSFVIAPKIMNQTITLVATDGHSVTYAGMIIHTGNEAKHRRTDRSGNITMPRFGTQSITIKDARYVEQTWQKNEIEPTLTVRRTVLGSGLDSLSDRLRRPAKHD